MMILRKTFEEDMAFYKTEWASFPWHDTNAYAAWLCQSYYYCAHTTRIISFAGSLFPFNKQELHNRFLDHASEEKNHEQLVIKDLKGLGQSLAHSHEYPETAALYQSQYYWAQHVNPISLYGYFLSLEGLAVNCGKIGEELVKKSHPKNTSNFLRVHANDDVEHLEEAFSKLKNITPIEEKWIVQNMKNTTQFYISMLAKARTAKGKKTQAAKAA